MVGKVPLDVDIPVETLLLLFIFLVVNNTVTVSVAKLDDKGIVNMADAEVLSSHIVGTSTGVEVACRGKRLDTEYSWFELVAKLALEAVNPPVIWSVRSTDEVANSVEAEKKLELEGFLTLGVVS